MGASLEVGTRWVSAVEELDRNIRVLSNSEDDLALEAVPNLRVIRDTLDALGHQDAAYGPPSLAGQIRDQLRRVGPAVNTLATPPRGDSPMGYEAYLADIVSVREWFVQHVSPFVRGPDQAEAAKAMANIQAMSEEMRQAADEAKGILRTMKVEAGEKQALDLAGNFEKAADSHCGWSWIWFAASALGLLGLLVLVYETGLSVWAGTATSDWATLAREGLPRLLILALATYGVRLLIRNYSINKHLEVTYRLRANILRTYMGLIDSMPDADKKGRMGMLLAQAAVTSTDSGYLQHAADSGPDTQSVTTLLSLLRK